MMKRKNPWTLIPFIILELIISIMLISHDNFWGAAGWICLMFTNIDIFFYLKTKQNDKGTNH